jgi:hypothetical protein
MSFHPLKAGRRRGKRLFLRRRLRVSIPSRRVGDHRQGKCVSCYRQFPSPQGGSETRQATVFAKTLARFHPLKAGRRQLVGQILLLRTLEFPSPQGGSETLTGAL